MIIKDIAVFWLQKFLSYISIALLLTSFSSCTHETNPNASISPDTIFFGDSTLTVISSNRPNGYLCKLFKSKDLVLLNLQRGDSINMCQSTTLIYLLSEELLDTLTLNGRYGQIAAEFFNDHSIFQSKNKS